MDRLSPSTDRLLAGAAMVDITPDIGIQLAGDIGRWRPTEEIREPLHAHCLVFAQADQMFCLLVLDLCAISHQCTHEIRQRAAERFGIPANALMIHTTQNHAAPSLGHLIIWDEPQLFPKDFPWLRGGDDAYIEPTIQNILTGMGEAIAKLAPVTVASGRGIDGRVAFNRRFVMRDGTAMCNPPPADPRILYCEGPADPEVGVTTFTNAAEQPVAVILHHTCHPAAGYPFRYTLGDWPGVWGTLVSQHLGNGCVPLVVNGCCGNINAPNFLRPTPRWPDWDYTHTDMGTKLTETTVSALNNMTPVSPPQMRYASRTFPIDMRPLQPDVWTSAKKLIAENPTPIWEDDEKTQASWEWIYAASILGLQARLQSDPFFDYEIQAVRIGNTVILGLIGEPFVEAQLKIKLESAAEFTFLAHMCNGYVGYIPTPAALQRGGYETEPAAWSCLVPEALKMIQDHSLQLIEELFIS